eukprot:TRINITY_DN1493_c0_g1_i4.p1 TRINITY_DN1493_c0_g1~~TRINITY_DN1493_c0_g1_i4.p1  ORF type:complete len:404 (+),score=63.82 TRINITY_DN1493_c0_g1_i4:75-1286(+)
MAMELESDPDMALSVPLKPLYEEYYCPICFSVIVECYMTPCGHLFCSECIKECLNRKHQCPCCNHPTQQKDLIRNLHGDRIISILEKEKEKASKQYFENLIKNNHNTGHSSGNSNNNNSNKIDTNLSPIETLFHKHMKKSLSSYEDYFQKLKEKHEKNKERIAQEFNNKMSKIQKKYPNNDEKSKERIEKKRLKYQKETEGTFNSMEESFQQSVQMLLDSYEKYLSTCIPAPTFLPVMLSVRILSRNIHIKNVQIKPTDTIEDLKEVIKKHFLSLGDPLVGFGKNISFTVKGTLDAGEISIGNRIPIVQYGLMMGSEIIVKGELKLKSDQPKKCFKNLYEPNKGLVMDYYACKDCKFNWICKPCAETCHKGHNISEYIMHHTPNWACCYCVKNGKCTIFEKKK